MAEKDFYALWWSCVRANVNWVKVEGTTLLANLQQRKLLLTLIIILILITSSVIFATAQQACIEKMQHSYIVGKWQVFAFSYLQRAKELRAMTKYSCVFLNGASLKSVQDSWMTFGFKFSSYETHRNVYSKFEQNLTLHALIFADNRFLWRIRWFDEIVEDTPAAHIRIPLQASAELSKRKIGQN